MFMQHKSIRKIIFYYGITITELKTNQIILIQTINNQEVRRLNTHNKVMTASLNNILSEIEALLNCEANLIFFCLNFG